MNSNYYRILGLESRLFRYKLFAYNNLISDGIKITFVNNSIIFISNYVKIFRNGSLIFIKITSVLAEFEWENFSFMK